MSCVRSILYGAGGVYSIVYSLAECLRVLEVETGEFLEENDAQSAPEMETTEIYEFRALTN